MRSGRLLSLLLLLQTRSRMTAGELARELEVSVRTIYRDVDALGASGVPIYADRGPTGGYRLLDGYRTRLTGLTADEADALVLAGLPGPAAELGLGTLLAGAQLKFLAALPPELRSRAGRVRERFLLDAPGWFRDAEPPAHLAAVADAVWNLRRVRVRYRRWGEREVTRTLEPLGLVLKGGAWYLVAGVVDRAERPVLGQASDRATDRATGRLRTYHASRILELETLEGRFERPEGFDLADFWRVWSAEFETRLYRQEAVVRFSPEAFGLLPHLVNATVARVVRESAEPPDAEGWRRARFPIESVWHAETELLRLGAGAEVLAPPELRERLAQAAAGLAAIYRFG
ncbi:MAG: Transcriptional regulator, DeoR family [uncultured Thermomicrobiales bacterium]|uniref:Transcriptional regulator, DeoR family n=1 Tax=uncultured Thermomicrobiales bacterium TaxID=1645740 RepID=A0A6J4VEC2_9BACT|nr:MAG: Transcriptional regulator, DeoR family [uncultured Thermomicrobiales bacterium]